MKNPKTENRMPKEIRKPNCRKAARTDRDFGFRAFGIHSDFGLRISHFAL